MLFFFSFQSSSTHPSLLNHTTTLVCSRHSTPNILHSTHTVRHVIQQHYKEKSVISLPPPSTLPISSPASTSPPNRSQEESTLLTVVRRLSHSGYVRNTCGHGFRGCRVIQGATTPARVVCKIPISTDYFPTANSGSTSAGPTTSSSADMKATCCRCGGEVAWTVDGGRYYFTHRFGGFMKKKCSRSIIPLFQQQVK